MDRGMTGEAVLLDLDGTLSNSRPGIEACFRYMLTELGHDPAAAGDLTWAVGPPIAVSIGRLLAQYQDDRVEAGLTTYRAHYSAVAIYDCTIYPGVPEMLGALRESGFVLCIATSKRRDFAVRVIDYLRLGGSTSAACTEQNLAAGWITRMICWRTSCAAKGFRPNAR